MEAAEPVITQQSPDETPRNQYSATFGFFVNTGLNENWCFLGASPLDQAHFKKMANMARKS